MATGDRGEDNNFPPSEIFKNEGGYFLSISEQLEKEKKIKQEINKLKKLYKDFEKDKSKAIDGLINRAAFTKITLEELEEDLMVNGLTELFEQGEQSFMRERPETKQYTTFLQRYSQVMKQLLDLLPIELAKQEQDALAQYLERKKNRK
ncbi:hypothetical protein [Veillonella sp.]|uniref:hypothetical protein n=1 Tax=Veillonella sp. TaxID=1926307 RepID=UPI002055EF0E|nr:hypothetical protein [Veillonella sp.]DAL52979.1 MAG TPA_asm: hypothetical protein [Caudoviricetes sp.]